MTTMSEPKKQKSGPTVLEEYDVATDAKKRISLRRAKAKYFRVRCLSNGSFLLEPRVLVPPQAVSARVLKMLDQSAQNLKKGVASPPIDRPMVGIDSRRQYSRNIYISKIQTSHR